MLPEILVFLLSLATVQRSSASPALKLTRPRVAFWCGKVNQHVSLLDGDWRTDSGGISGCYTDRFSIVQYCRKMYPFLTIIDAHKDSIMFIRGWCERYNFNCIYNSAKTTFLCIETYSVAISPQLLSIVVGSVGQFNCNSSGNPTLDLEWLFDGVLIIPDDIDINITQKTASEFLQLSKLTYRVKEKSLGGVHKVTCRAKNHTGSNDSTSSLAVEVGGEIRKQEIQNTFNVVGGKAKSISLPCPSYGYPLVHRIWLKGKVAVDVKQSRINMSATGSLVIGHVDVADEGEYTCNIKNTVGKKTFTDSVKMNLTVTGKETFVNGICLLLQNVTTYLKLCCYKVVSWEILLQIGKNDTSIATISIQSSQCMQEQSRKETICDAACITSFRIP